MNKDSHSTAASHVEPRYGTGHSVIGVYDTLMQAEKAVHHLDESRFPTAQISIIGPQAEEEGHELPDTADEALLKTGTRAGAWAGGVFGVLAGTAAVWIPGLGRLFLAGPFASVLLGMMGGLEGAVTGAAWGGMLATLLGWGVSSQHLSQYEEHLTAGNYLLIAHGDAAEVDLARHILQQTSAQHVQLHTKSLEAS